MRLFPDRRPHTCPDPGILPAVDHHLARQIVPDRGAVAAKLIRQYPPSTKNYPVINICHHIRQILILSKESDSQ